MTLEQFNREFVPVLTLVLTSLGLVSLLMLWWQLRQTTIWNKLQSQHSFRGSPSFGHLRRVVEAAAAMGMDLKGRTEPLSSEEVDRLWNDKEAYWAVHDYLNELETVCTAVRVGCVDAEVAYSEHSAPVIGASTLFDRWINKVRTMYSDEELYCEIDRVAVMWQTLDEKKGKARERAKTRLERERKRLTGVRPKV